eukprot:1184427-Pyramimonas_sp.AAC.1
MPVSVFDGDLDVRASGAAPSRMPFFRQRAPLDNATRGREEADGTTPMRRANADPARLGGAPAECRAACTSEKDYV